MFASVWGGKGKVFLSDSPPFSPQHGQASSLPIAPGRGAGLYPVTSLEQLCPGLVERPRAASPLGTLGYTKSPQNPDGATGCSVEHLGAAAGKTQPLQRERSQQKGRLPETGLLASRSAARLGGMMWKHWRPCCPRGNLEQPGCVLWAPEPRLSLGMGLVSSPQTPSLFIFPTLPFSLLLSVHVLRNWGRKEG